MCFLQFFLQNPLHFGTTLVSFSLSTTACYRSHCLAHCIRYTPLSLLLERVNTPVRTFLYLKTYFTTQSRLIAVVFSFQAHYAQLWTRIKSARWHHWLPSARILPISCTCRSQTTSHWRYWDFTSMNGTSSAIGKRATAAKSNLLPADENCFCLTTIGLNNAYFVNFCRFLLCVVCINK